MATHRKREERYNDTTSTCVLLEVLGASASRPVFGNFPRSGLKFCMCMSSFSSSSSSSSSSSLLLLLFLLLLLSLLAVSFSFCLLFLSSAFSFFVLLLRPLFLPLLLVLVLAFSSSSFDPGPTSPNPSPRFAFLGFVVVFAGPRQTKTKLLNRLQNQCFGGYLYDPDTPSRTNSKSRAKREERKIN